MVLNWSLCNNVFPPADKLPLLGHGRYQGTVLRDLIPLDGHKRLVHLDVLGGGIEPASIVLVPLDLSKHLLIGLAEVPGIKTEREVLAVSHGRLCFEVRLRTLVEVHTRFHLLGEILELRVIYSQNAVLVVACLKYVRCMLLV